MPEALKAAAKWYPDGVPYLPAASLTREQRSALWVACILEIDLPSERLAVASLTMEEHSVGKACVQAVLEKAGVTCNHAFARFSCVWGG